MRMPWIRGGVEKDLKECATDHSKLTIMGGSEQRWQDIQRQKNGGRQQCFGPIRLLSHRQLGPVCGTP